MPLVRKTGGQPPGVAAALADVLEGLTSADESMRWNAAREAAQFPECAAPLAAALRTESAPRVREVMFTSLARLGTAASTAELLPLLRSDDASLRTGALDALRIVIRANEELLPPLLADADVDIRILSCELARSMQADKATSLLSAVLQREQDGNVCAAAVDVLAEVGTRDALPALAACAQRFPHSAFLVFAIRVTSDGISAQQPTNRG
jgi:HEAT repeat protein